MKRSLVIIFSLLFSLFTLTRPTPVRAENTMFTTTDLADWVSTAIIEGNKYGINIAGLIVPSYKSQAQTAIFDYEPYSVTMQAWQEGILPGDLRANNKVRDWILTQVRRLALYGIIMRTWAEHGTDEKSPECVISQDLQVSEPLDFVRELWQGGYFADSMMGLGKLEPNDQGIFDMNRPEMGLAGMNAAEDCKKHMAGVNGVPNENDQVQLSSFLGEGTLLQGHMLVSLFIEKIVTFVLDDGTEVEETVKEPEYENANKRGKLTKKERQMWQESNCYFSGKPCPGNMVGPTYTPHLGDVAGFPASFVADSRQEEVDPHTTLHDKVKIFGFPIGKVEDFDLVSNRMQHGFKTMACTVVPDGELQENTVIGWLENYVHINDYCAGPSLGAEVASCESPFFDKLKAGIDYSQLGRAADPGYTIPYRDASQSLTEELKANAKKIAVEGYSGGATAVANIDKYWADIDKTSKQYGWNPVFVVALWIEESAAGGHPNASHDLGCLYGWDKPNGQGPAVSMPTIGEGNVCDQMACLFSHPVKNKDDFSGFMCSYNSDDVSVAQYQCQASSGWPFAKNLQTVYDLLINGWGTDSSFDL